MSKWQDIVQVFKGTLGWYGLNRMGTVLFAPHGKNDMDKYHGQDKVDGLKDIKCIKTEYNGRIICIKNDGTLAATEFINGKDDSCWDEMSTWIDIVDLFDEAQGRLIGIKSDGSLIATRYINDDEEYSQGGDDKWYEMSKWTDIVQLIPLWDRIVGLDAYGELVTTTKYRLDDERYEEYDYWYKAWNKISLWKELIYYEENKGYAIGLKSDGTVLVEKWFKENDEEKEDNGQADVSNWRDIIYISSSWRKTLGVKKDGTVLVTEDDYGDHGENNVKSFKLFADVDELQKSIVEHEEFAKKEAEKKICEKKQAIYNNTILVINAEFEKELKPHIEKIAAKYLEQRQYLINARD